MRHESVFVIFYFLAIIFSLCCTPPRVHHLYEGCYELCLVMTAQKILWVWYIGKSCEVVTTQGGRDYIGGLRTPLTSLSCMEPLLIMKSLAHPVSATRLLRFDTPQHASGDRHISVVCTLTNYTIRKIPLTTCGRFFIML